MAGRLVFWVGCGSFLCPSQTAPEQEFSLPATTTCTKKREHRMRVDQIRVDEAQVVEEADSLRLTFPVTHGQTQTPVWFKVRNADAAPSGNAALAIALVPAMRAARSLVLADSLSPRLFASQAAIQKLFQDWDDQFNVVRDHCSSWRAPSGVNRRNWSFLHRRCRLILFVVKASGRNYTSDLCARIRYQA